MAYTTIKKPSDYFNTVTYTGDGTSSRNITGVGFQPDLLWIKNRDITQWHFLFDAVRGVSKALFSNVTNAESTQASTQTAFLSDGFTVGNDVASNGNGNGIVSWNWLGANGTASNTDGSITSTVSANTTSGFSIVSYTGNETTGATVGHGLSSTPKMIILKNRNSTDDWVVYHESLGNTQSIRLNLTNASATTPASFNNTSPTSSVFTLGDWTGVNGSSMIAYCFAEKQGFSKFGSYTGNGSTDGTFVYTGFKPAFVIFKNTTNTNNWSIRDNKRDSFNAGDSNLFANLSDAESSSNDIDFLSNGFKLRNAGGNWNTSGNTYIYMAFAAEPLVGDNPATAR
jgi:hypothetical protein